MMLPSVKHFAIQLLGTMLAKMGPGEHHDLVKLYIDHNFIKILYDLRDKAHLPFQHMFYVKIGITQLRYQFGDEIGKQLQKLDKIQYHSEY